MIDTAGLANESGVSERTTRHWLSILETCYPIHFVRPHARNFGKSFQIMREVVEKYPVSPQVNEAYYYIGLGHFQLGHYSRAITALEKVGTTLSGESGKTEKLEAGKRFFIKIEDADLAVLEPSQTVKVLCKTSGGDEELVDAFPVGRNVRLVLGSLPSKLGRPIQKNGTLEVRGGDKILVTYTDEHPAESRARRRSPVAVLRSFSPFRTTSANTWSCAVSR